MKLHTRLVLLLALTFGVFLSIGVAIIYSVIRPAFEQLEQEEAVTNVKRVQKALQSQLAGIDQKLLDWSNWDDTKDFVQSRTPEYIDGNLNASTITNLNLSFMAFYNLEGSPVWVGGYDLETGELTVLPELSDPTVIRPFLSTAEKSVEISGVWVAGSGTYLMAARPVLDSQSEGPAAGTLLFGRQLEDAFIAELREQTEVPFEIATLPPGASAKMEPSDEPREIARTTEALRHSVVWSDLLGDPRLEIEVDTPRDISEAGNRTIRLAIVFLVCAAIIDMTVIAFAISFLVARPVRALTQQVARIGSSGDLSGRLGWTRRDELGTLASQFDQMVSELAEARRQLLEMSYKVGRSEVASGVLHNVRNALSPLANQIQRARALLATPVGAHLAQAVVEVADPATAPERRAKLADYVAASARQEADLRRRAADEIQNAAQGLSVVERILADQQATADLDVAPQELSLAEIVAETLKQIGTEANGVAIAVDPSVGRAPNVRVHRPIAIHVLHNVIANALTAVTAAPAADRRIEISVGDRSEVGQIVLKIHDNGIGIAPEHLPQVFRNGFTTKPGGKGGEGLHWCANALAKLKGKIWAESPGPGAGATFFIELAAA